MVPDLWEARGEGDWLSTLTYVEDDIFTLVPEATFDLLAKETSLHTAGLWFVRDGGLTWAVGSRKTAFLHPSLLPELQAARAICAGLGAECGRSLGSCAARLLRWLARPEYPFWGRLDLHKSVPWALNLATPGEWRYAHKYDVRSYYWSLFSRLPTLRAHLQSDGTVAFGLWEPGEEPRWEALKAAVATHKGLRNALVGVAYGGGTATRCWHRGELVQIRRGAGPFATAGLLTVRAGYELARDAADECGAVWGHTDGLIVPDGAYPQLWAAFGLTVRDEAEGDAEVFHLTAYRVGSTATGHYTPGSRYKHALPLLPRPDTLFYPSWLATA